MMWRLGLILVLSISLVSCSAKFACKDKVNIDGERCEDLTTVHEKHIEKRVEKAKEPKPDPSSLEEVGIVRSMGIETEKPLRLPPRVIRIWIAPWEDVDGDLHQSSFIYSEISPKRGRWLLGEKEVTSNLPVFRPLEKVSGKTTPEPGIPKEEKEKIEKKPVLKQPREKSPQGLVQEERR